VQFRDLNEAQILALAITAEEEDARIYRDFAESLRADFPATAELFTKMAGEEDGHRHRLIESYRQRYGEHIPLIRRQDVKGFVVRRPSWFTQTLRPEHAREEAALMEIESRRFYEAAAQRTNDAGIRQLLDDLAQEEQRHEATAEEITDEQAKSGAAGQEREVARRLFVLRFVQPGLAGLMDGSVLRSHHCLPPHSPPVTRWLHSRSGLQPRLALALAWASPRPCPMTANSAGVAHLGFAVLSAA
jgi:rubrerythrin